MRKFKFGKYKDQEVTDILEKDPDYIVWFYENVEKQDIVDEDDYEEALINRKYQKK